jgi:hypothetical protein
MLDTNSGPISPHSIHSEDDDTMGTACIAFCDGQSLPTLFTVKMMTPSEQLALHFVTNEMQFLIMVLCISQQCLLKGTLKWHCPKLPLS